MGTGPLTVIRRTCSAPGDHRAVGLQGQRVEKSARDGHHIAQIASEHPSGHRDRRDYIPPLPPCRPISMPDCGTSRRRWPRNCWRPPEKISSVLANRHPSLPGCRRFQRQAVPPAARHHDGVGQIGRNDGLAIIIGVRRIIDHSRSPRDHVGSGINVRDETNQRQQQNRQNQKTSAACSRSGA